MTDYANLGEALARLRKRSGLTQKDIAEAMEITVSSVSRFEQPEVNPQWSKLIRFLDAVGCDLEDLHAELTGGSGDPLSEADINTIRAWITAGAENN